jgi:hypothetical protein
MLADLFKSFSPIEEDGLHVVQGQFLTCSVKGGHHVFNRLKHPIPDFLLQHSKQQKVAQTQVWRIKWVGNAVKLQIGKLISHVETMVIHVQTILLLASTLSGRRLLMKYPSVNCTPDGSIFTMIRRITLKKSANITLCAPFVAFSFGIASSPLAERI